MKVTVLKEEREKKKNTNSIFSSILLFVLGIILTFRSEEIISMIFSVIGFLVLLYGVYKFYSFYKLKQQFQTEDSQLLMNGIMFILLGLVVLFLSSFFANAIQMVTGIWLIFLGLQKIYNSSFYIHLVKREFLTNLISGLILLFLGIYTIVAQNVVFIFIGIALILYSGLDLFQQFFKK